MGSRWWSLRVVDHLTALAAFAPPGASSRGLLCSHRSSDFHLDLGTFRRVDPTSTSSRMSVLPPSIHPHPQWIFTPSELLNNPSTRLSSVPFHAELEARNAACRWAGRLTMSLHRDNDCHFIAATACIFIQRTYMRFTIEQFPPRVRLASPLAARPGTCPDRAP